MNKYEIILYWSEDDGAYIAEVPELPGCIAHAATQIEALAKPNDAILFWIDTARETGRAMPLQKGRKLGCA